MITKETYNLSVSHLKTQIEKIESTENLNFLWEVALKLNNNKLIR